MNAELLINWLKLQENPDEGGYFAATYESPIKIKGADLPGFKPIKGERSICGAIYYFLDSHGYSVMHRVTGDMIYHFYSGDPVEMLLLYPEGSTNKDEVCIFSNDMDAGASPMKVIPGGTWMGSRLIPGGDYALMGVTMSPGFNPADYSIGDREELIKEYPEQESRIIDLTRG